MSTVAEFIKSSVARPVKGALAAGLIAAQVAAAPAQDSFGQRAAAPAKDAAAPKRLADYFTPEELKALKEGRSITQPNSSSRAAKLDELAKQLNLPEYFTLSNLTNQNNNLDAKLDKLGLVYSKLNSEQSEGVFVKKVLKSGDKTVTFSAGYGPTHDYVLHPTANELAREIPRMERIIKLGERGEAAKQKRLEGDPNNSKLAHELLMLRKMNRMFADLVQISRLSAAIDQKKDMVEALRLFEELRPILADIGIKRDGRNWNLDPKHQFSKTDEGILNNALIALGYITATFNFQDMLYPGKYNIPKF